MNRPPGDGFPYDAPSPIPAEYGVQPGPGRVLCGYPYKTADDPEGPVLCKNTAPCPLHRNYRVGELEATEAALNEATPEPAPSLYQSIAGGDLPSFGELRERYGDPADLHPIPKYDPDSPVDLHKQLHPVDDQPWSVRARLAESLGRRALATRLADALPPLLGAELADRLDTLITQAITEHDAAVTQQMADHYFEARARLDAEAEAKLQELRRERFKPSRLD